MPELPEVTTTTRGLLETVIGKSIIDVWSGWKKHIKDPKFNTFKKEVVGKKITGAKRHGKNILIELDSGKHILVHMKMTGHLLYGHYKFGKGVWKAVDSGPLRDDPRNQFIHLVFKLANKEHLVLSDMRKFAKIKLVNESDPLKHEDLRKLGPDALNISYKTFKNALLNKPRSKIKQVMLNQEIIAGVGNIYSDESLWMSGIHPESNPGAIPDKSYELLHKSLQEILKKGIKLSGDSDSDYRNIYGLPGNMQKHHQVYRRRGERCLKKNCRGRIERIIVGGRSTHFCPLHQKKFIIKK